MSHICDLPQAAVAALDPPRKDPLDVYVQAPRTSQRAVTQLTQLGCLIWQVNTSPWEGTKGGVLAEEAPELAMHVRRSANSFAVAPVSH